jgi:redox-regulated HSP33 family molecular chaperone
MASNIFTRDVALKVTSRCRQFRVVVVSTRGVLHETMTRHELFPSAAANEGNIFETAAGVLLPQLAGVITLTNMWAALLNHEERVRVEFYGEHAVPTAESLALGETRAFLQPGNLQAGAVKGTLRVHRVLYGHMQPFTSATIAPGSNPDDPCLALQAMHHCAQSDGVQSAIFLAAAFDPITAVPAYSAGVMVQPIAPSEERSGTTLQQISALQRVFTQLMGYDVAEPISLDSTPTGLVAARSTAAPEDSSEAATELVRSTIDRRFRQGWAAHDLLALATGDWSGAAAVVEAARIWGGPTSRRLAPRLHPHHPSTTATSASGSIGTPPVPTATVEDAASAEGETTTATALDEFDLPAPYEGLAGETVVAPLKGRWLGATDSRGAEPLLLDQSTMVKTPLDFFCRCSKHSFKAALQAVGEKGVRQRYEANPNMAFPCQHCNRQWSLDESDWQEVLDTFRVVS